MGAEEKYSITTGDIRTFGTVDYVLFSIVLVLNAVIGLYYAYKDRHNITTNEFMVGGKTMYIFPVSMSLAVTFLSAMSLLGNPVEIYTFNTMFWYLVFGLLLAVAAAAHVFMPFFFRLNVTTVFEYLQMRFNTPVRILGSVLTILQTLNYFSFILYAPSLALSSVTHINLWGSVVGMGVLVTFYTTLGGMKAVVWTDTLQAAVILAGFLATFIRGSIVVGGFGDAWKIADARDRIKFDNFSVDPSTRHSFWSVILGAGFFWMSLYGINQAQIQRCLSCPTVKKAQIALWINLVGIVFITSLCFMTGIVMFAFYANCHPKGIISKNDQLLPLFVMDILADYEGVPGIFVACIFSGSLSSLSSGLNAISAVTVKDLIVPYCGGSRFSDFKTTMISKVLVVVYGGVGMAFAFLVSRVDRVMEASYSVYSIINGPMFGLFVLGMFFPWANSCGAFIGCFVSLVFMSWICIGKLWHDVSAASASNTTTDGCVWSMNTTTAVTPTISATLLNTTLPAVADDPTNIPAYGLYTMSYLWYTITGATVVVIVGLIASLIASCITGFTKPSSLDPRLICPLFDHIFPCLPECILRPLRCGIDHKDKYEKYDRSVIEFEEKINREISESIRRKSGPPRPIMSLHKSSPSRAPSSTANSGVNNPGLDRGDENFNINIQNTRV